MQCIMQLCHFKGSPFTIASVNCKSALFFSQVCDYTEVANAWSQHLKLTSCLPHLQTLPQQDVEHLQGFHYHLLNGTGVFKKHNIRGSPGKRYGFKHRLFLLKSLKSIMHP